TGRKAGDKSGDFWKIAGNRKGRERSRARPHHFTLARPRLFRLIRSSNFDFGPCAFLIEKNGEVENWQRARVEQNPSIGKGSLGRWMIRFIDGRVIVGGALCYAAQRPMAD